jgi:hypothetical protein
VTRKKVFVFANGGEEKQRSTIRKRRRYGDAKSKKEFFSARNGAGKWKITNVKWKIDGSTKKKNA